MEYVTRAPWGELSGQAVELFTLTNRRGSTLKVTSYGAAITELYVPDRRRRFRDVVLGFDRLERYVEHKAFFGATIGRVANRIRGAQFELGGRRYELAATDGADHLHGGRRGWDRLVWSGTERADESGPGVELRVVSPDGDEGYPGRVTASVVYTLTHDDALIIDMSAETDRTTLVNMAHHTYWNLAGHDGGDVLEHELTLAAAEYTPGDPVVPTGRVESVARTPFDFREPRLIGEAIERLRASGFDHNFIVQGAAAELRPVARLADPRSGRVMTLEANAPGVQVYTGNFLDGTLTGKGQSYERHGGICLETQAFPNAINVPEWAPQVILEPGRRYQHRMVHRFSSDG